MSGDILAELEKLKARKAELSGMIGATRDQDRKADLRDQLVTIQRQIEMLEKFYVRRK